MRSRRVGKLPSWDLSRAAFVRTVRAMCSARPACVRGFVLLLWLSLMLPGASPQPNDVKPPDAKPGDVGLSLELVPAARVAMAHAPLLAVVNIDNKLTTPVRLRLGSVERPAIQFHIYDAQGNNIAPRTAALPTGFGLSDIVTIRPAERSTTFELVDRHYHFRAPGRYKVNAYLLDWASCRGVNVAWPDAWPVLAMDSVEVSVEPASPTALAQAWGFLISRACNGLRGRAPAELMHPLWQSDDTARQLDNKAAAMLGYMTHESAIPYLAQAALNGSSTALAGLRRIGTPEAIRLLRGFAGSRNPALAIAAFRELRMATDGPVELAPAEGANE